MPTPTFFPTSTDFRVWLEQHAACVPELLVGLHKVDSGYPSMTWPESVDEALCFGWIDGVRRRIDDTAYSIRFTPRRAASIWSAVNIAKVEWLQSQGRMTPAGLLAYSRRQSHRSVVYAYEQTETAALTAPELLAFQRVPLAWAFFEASPPGYQKQMLHRLSSAKKAETRAARFERLLQASAAGLRLS